MPPAKKASSRNLAARGVRVAGVPENVTVLVEQIVSRVVNPLDLVIISRQRLAETLGEAVERGRITKTDADVLLAEIVGHSLRGTDDLMGLARGLARRRGEEQVPVEGYDGMTARQAIDAMRTLEESDQRRLRDYERKHANRKSVLDALDRAIGQG